METLYVDWDDKPPYENLAWNLCGWKKRAQPERRKGVFQRGRKR